MKEKSFNLRDLLEKTSKKELELLNLFVTSTIVEKGNSEERIALLDKWANKFGEIKEEYGNVIDLISSSLEGIADGED